MIGVSVQYHHIPVLLLLIPKFIFIRILLNNQKEKETRKQELAPIMKQMIQELPRGLLAKVEVNHWLITLRNI